jgi:RNA polymerase sigma-70 factor (ECF subfamily)
MQTTPKPDRMEASAHDSWMHWYQHYGPKLLLCARQWTNSLADAEDVVQEAFVRYWRHQRDLPGEPMALLVTSARRAAFDLARRESRRARRDEFGGEPETESPYFRPSLEVDERREAVEAAIRQLPLEQREVLVLKIWGELTFQQIASELQIPPNTAASRYRYAMATLRLQLTAAGHHA